MVGAWRLALGLTAGVIGCTPSPHIYDFDGGPTACQLTEICNGVDDDCNGLVDDLDEHLSQPSSNQAGICAGARLVCEGGAWREPTVPPPEADANCDGLDDDCDGLIDEAYAQGSVGCPAQRCSGACCDFDRGARMHCVEGDLHCFLAERDGAEVVVYRLPFEAPESCDGYDNDCDGDTDEGFDIGGACVADFGICQRDGVAECAPDGSLACVPGMPRSAEPEAERCNGRDDDCDGVTDEADPALQTPCEPEEEACAGGLACVDGALRCEPARVAETCNGVDDDCDGTTDEGDDLQALGCTSPPPNAAPESCTDGECVYGCGGDFFDAAPDDPGCEAAAWAGVGIAGFGEAVSYWCGTLRASGRVRCWARADDGAMAPRPALQAPDEGAPYSQVITTAYLSCALADGQIGCRDVATPGERALDAQALASGAGAGQQVCGLDADGALHCSTWEGSAAGPYQARSLSVGAAICAIENDEATCWEAPGGPPVEMALTGAPTCPEGAERCSEAVRVGLEHYCLRLSDGTVECWALAGDQPAVELPESVTTARFAALAVGARVACGVTRGPDSGVMCWTLPPLGPGGQAVAAATVDPPRAVADADTVDTVIMGPFGSDACALGASGELMCWSVASGALQPIWTAPSPP